MPPIADLGFTYQTRKSGEVHILHRGAPATVLRGSAAEEFLAEVVSGSPEEGQQLMARITGNFKRGNERLAADHPRNRR